MHIKKMMALAAGSLAIAAQALTLSVKDVKIAQRYPWNGLVDIDYTIVCDDPDADVYVYPVGYDVDMNVSVAPRTLTGDGANGKAVKAGTHRMTWDMGTDMGANYNRAKFSMKMHAYANAAPYLVIDLSAGPEATKYEVSYLSEMPDSEWSDDYKKNKLVLKLVCPGTFMMGSPIDELGRSPYEAREMLHKVTLTQPFYMGIFELTQQQYNLVMGSNPSNYKGDSRPVENVSYNTIRGSTLGAAWPNHRQVDASSFMGKLRSRTGLTFDLPTEAQWEYACRAGTGSALNNGKELNEAMWYYRTDWDSSARVYVTNVTRSASVDDVGRYCGNYANDNSYHSEYDGRGGYSGAHTIVGCYKPNAWGFYDMHGNVREWCLDWWQDKMSPSAATDPLGPSSGNNYRVSRGGCYYEYANYVRSSARNQEYVQNGQGFRVACLPAE